MDQTLSRNRTTSQSDASLIARSRLLLIGSLSLVLAGCQLPRMAASLPIPAPPASINTTDLENVRYQSPDSDQEEDRVVSRNRIDFGAIESVVDDAETAPRQDASRSERIADVRFRGNRNVPTNQLKRNIQTRPGRLFDPDKLQQDVNELWRMPEISRVNEPLLERTDDGIIITLEVEERKSITEVEFVGNRGIPDRVLKKETGLQDGKPLDVHQIRMAKTRLEELYQEKGYPRTQVEIMEGGESGDAKVVFLIHEDEKQRIWKVEFEGNSIATDARLKNFIESKPGIMKVFGGLVKRNEIDQDVTRLISYYRSLGFFNAQIGREISESNDGRWLTLRFIINEGPRYRIRNVTFVGNQSFSAEDLESMVELKPMDAEAPDFNVSKMNQDVVALRDLYGGQGFIFASIEAEPRFLEEPGLLDIVYKIEEGKQYYAGNINVHYVGGNAITKRETVLNPISVRPGDLIDIREIRASIRRLGASQVFATGQGGSPPDIVLRPPEIKDLERMAQQQGGGTVNGSQRR